MDAKKIDFGRLIGKTVASVESIATLGSHDDLCIIRFTDGTKLTIESNIITRFSPGSEDISSDCLEYKLEIGVS